MEFGFVGICFALLISVFYCFSRKAKTQTLEMTLEELSKFDGSNGKVYMSVSGNIFDVSACEAYYPGGNYSVFAGKDGTVALAKMSLDAKHMNVEETLTSQELKTLEEWVVYYRDTKKYPIIGRISNKKKL